MKVRPRELSLEGSRMARQLHNSKSFSVPAGAMKNPDGRIKYNYRQLELDSVTSMNGVSRVTPGFSGIEPEDSMLE